MSDKKKGIPKQKKKEEEVININTSFYGRGWFQKQENLALDLMKDLGWVTEVWGIGGVIKGLYWLAEALVTTLGEIHPEQETTIDNYKRLSEVLKKVVADEEGKWEGEIPEGIDN
jgi:hypothetical protein